MIEMYAFSRRVFFKATESKFKLCIFIIAIFTKLYFDYRTFKYAYDIFLTVICMDARIYHCIFTISNFSNVIFYFIFVKKNTYFL